MEMHTKSTHEDIEEKARHNDAIKLNNSYQLQNHKIHNRSKKHMCSYCGFATSHKEGLKLHIKAIHHKIRDKICDMCGYSASHDTLLKQHVKLVHEKKKDNVCESCGYKTSKKQNLQVHIKAVHEKVKDKVCSLCDYSTSSDSNLKKHMKIVHDKIKDKVCHICGHSTSLTGDLRKHMRVVHKVIMKAPKQMKYTPSSYQDTYNFISDTKLNIKDGIKISKLAFTVKNVDGGETKNIVCEPKNELKNLQIGVCNDAPNSGLCDVVNDGTKQTRGGGLERPLISVSLSHGNCDIFTNSRAEFNSELLTPQSKELKTENDDYSDNKDKKLNFPKIENVDDFARQNLEDDVLNEISSISKLVKHQPEECDADDTFDYLIINCTEANFQENSNLPDCQSIPKKIVKVKKHPKEKNGLCSEDIRSKDKRRKKEGLEQNCKMCSYSTSHKVNLNRHINVFHCNTPPTVIIF